MEHKPDTIKISASQKEEISATHADLHVTIKGSSIISGGEALKKAKEVNQLVEALTSFGVNDEAIKLQGVHVETTSGVLLKSSGATYRLKIRCEDLSHFASLLDIIASQKNATLERVEWKYDEDEARERMLKVVIEKAKVKAKGVASSLGVKLLGIYDFIENAYDEETPIPYQAKAAFRSAPAPAEPGLSMDVQHSKMVHMNVEIWYRVSAF